MFSGIRIRPAFAQAKKTTTCSGLVAVSVATRSPGESPASSRPAASRSERASSSAYVVSTPRQSIATRAGVVRARSRIQRPRVSSPAHEELRHDGDEAVGLLPEEEVAAAGEELDAGARNPEREQGRVPGVHNCILRPVEDERRRSDPCDAVERVECRPRRCLRAPGLDRLRRSLAVAQDPLDELRVGLRRERVLDELAQGGAAREQLHGLLGHREGLGAAGRGAREHEPVDALRLSERELLRDHAAKARPEHVRPLDAGLVEHLRRVGGQLGSRIRPGWSIALADAAVVEQDHVEGSRQRLDDRLPAPAGIAEPVDQEQRRAAAMTLPGELHCIPSSGSIRRRRRTRSAAGSASPPGTKKTSRMKSVPRMKSGSDSGVRQHRRQILDPRGAGERAEPLVGERVEEAAEERAVARPGAAEHDHHEQRQGEARRRHLRRRAGRGRAARRRRRAVARNEASTKASSLKGRAAARAPRRARSFSRIACQTRPGELSRPPSARDEHDRRVTEREPVEVLRVEDADEGVRDRLEVQPEALLAAGQPVGVLLHQHLPGLRERERHHRERDPADAQADRAEHERQDDPDAGDGEQRGHEPHSHFVSAIVIT